MRRELANSSLKATIQIKQIDLRNLYIRIWSCLDLNCLFFEADSEYELENINFQNFWNFYFFPLNHVNPHRAFACMRGGEAAE